MVEAWKIWDIGRQKKRRERQDEKDGQEPATESPDEILPQDMPRKDREKKENPRVVHIEIFGDDKK